MVHGSAEETAPPQHPQGQFEQLAQLKFAMDAQLLDPHVLTLAFRFYNLLCDVCVRMLMGARKRAQLRMRRSRVAAHPFLRQHLARSRRCPSG